MVKIKTGEIAQNIVSGDSRKITYIFQIYTDGNVLIGL